MEKRKLSIAACHKNFGILFFISYFEIKRWKSNEDVTIVDAIENYAYEKFVHILDGEETTLNCGKLII